MCAVHNCFFTFYVIFFSRDYCLTFFTTQQHEQKLLGHVKMLKPVLKVLARPISYLQDDSKIRAAGYQGVIELEGSKLLLLLSFKGSKFFYFSKFIWISIISLDWILGLIFDPWYSHTFQNWYRNILFWQRKVCNYYLERSPLHSVPKIKMIQLCCVGSWG